MTQTEPVTGAEFLAPSLAAQWHLHRFLHRRRAPPHRPLFAPVAKFSARVDDCRAPEPWLPETA